MQRVASKPPAHPDAPRRTRTGASTRTATGAAHTGAGTRTATGKRTATSTRTADSTRTASTRTATRPRQAVGDDLTRGERATPAPRHRSRVEILAGWAAWEVLSVPRTRLRWLKDLLLGA